VPLLHERIGAQDELQKLMQHDWIPSTLGHGNLMCRRCWATDLEAAAIGLIDCPGSGRIECEGVKAPVEPEPPES
jgi:hypothetical protein